MSYRPTLDVSSISVLIGTAGGGAITAGSAALGPVSFQPLPGHSSAQYFSSADEGCFVSVLGAGPGGGIHFAHILSVTDTQRVVLDSPASTTVDGGTVNVCVYRPCNIARDSVTYESSLTARDTASFTAQSPDGSFTPAVGQPVLLASTDASITDAYGVFFGGSIDSVVTSTRPGSAYQSHECSCISWESLASRRVMMAKAYTGQTANAVMADIVATGLNGEGVSVISSSSPVITYLAIESYTVVSDAMDQVIAAISLDGDVYFWKFDPWRRVILGNQASTPAPWSISLSAHTADNALAQINTTRTREKLCNRAYVDAAAVLASPVTETSHGTLNKRLFKTGVTPAIPPTAKVNGSSVVVGQTTVDPDDYSTYEDQGYGVSWIVNITGSSPNWVATLVSGNSFVSGMVSKDVVCNGNPYVATYTDATHLAMYSLAGGPAATGALLYIVPVIPAGCAWAWTSGTDKVWTDIYHSGLNLADTMAITYQSSGAQRAFAEYTDSVIERASVEGGTGYYEATAHIEYPIDPASLPASARAAARRLGDMPTKVEVSTRRGGLKVGQELTVDIPTARGTLIVSSVSMTIDQGWPLWAIEAVSGSIIGDWRSALGIIGRGGGSGGSVTIPDVLAPAGDLTYTIVDGTATPALAGTGTTGDPFVLPPSNQTLDVTATAQAVFLLLPAEAGMQGKSVTINRNAASALSVWARPNTGDDISGSGSDYEMADAGAVTLKGI